MVVGGIPTLPCRPSIQIPPWTSALLFKFPVLKPNLNHFKSYYRHPERLVWAVSYLGQVRVGFTHLTTKHSIHLLSSTLAPWWQSKLWEGFNQDVIQIPDSPKQLIVENLDIIPDSKNWRCHRVVVQSQYSLLLYPRTVICSSLTFPDIRSIPSTIVQVMFHYLEVGWVIDQELTKSTYEIPIFKSWKFWRQKHLVQIKGIHVT